ncbi:putative methyltransferase-domain-containing protein [Dichotomocladium elegans]|nr:putative methyltransferase-domain-containing protein [Dichotomocladium elegans]
MMSSPEDGDSSSNSSISTTSSSSNSNSGSRTSFDDDSSSSSSSSSSRNWCSNSTLNDKSAYSIEIRPLQLDAWDSNNSDTDTTVTTPSRYCQNPEVPGFFCSGTGGLEFRVSGHYQDTTKAKYFLYISPTLSDSNSLQAMPLILGPIEVVQDLGERRNAGWFTEQDILNEMFRAYSLNRLLSQSIPPPRLPCAFALKDTYFLVKENWKMGTWGKAWDSALVLSDMFARQIWRDPQWLDGCHIVDLSAGTGCMALLLGYILGHLDPDYTTKFTLTDLEDALELIRYNYQLNFGNNLEHDKNISIQRLRWGSSKDAKAVYRNSGKPDIIIASDVLYEPNCFPLLVRSLALLSEPGKTVIYLGYKKRGLQDKDERLFFDMAKKHFHMEKIGKEGEPPFEYTAPVAWEKRHGFITRNAGGETDGMGWIDRLPDISNSKWSSGPGSGGPGQSNVQVYRMVRKSTPN